MASTVYLSALAIFSVLLIGVVSGNHAFAVGGTIDGESSCTSILNGAWNGIIPTCTVTSFTINSGETLTIVGVFLDNSGIITNYGDIITNYGDIRNYGTINNYGEINNNFSGYIDSYGTINNNSGGTINNNSGGTINNNFSGYINNSGTITDYCKAEFYNIGILLGNAVVNACQHTATSLASTPNPSTFGQQVTFTATVSPVPSSGQVQFKVDGTKIGTSPISGSTATLSTSSLSVGPHSITAQYLGNANYSSSISSPLSQIVNPINTTTTLVSSQNPSTFGQQVTFTATVVPSSATGDVTFTIDNTPQTPVSVTSGQATLSTSSLAAGSHNVTAAYSGDDTHAASTSDALNQTVNQGSTTTVVIPNNTSAIVGQNVTLTATVSRVPPSDGTPTGTIQFQINGADAGLPVPLASSQASMITSSLAEGSNNVTAVYSGDDNFVSSTSDTVTVTVYSKDSLKGADLSGVDLSNISLRGADLSGSTLQGTSFSGSNLKDVNATGADLSGADLSGTDLSSADLSGADLSGADLSGTNLSGANLQNANLQNADLTNANLSGADLTGADLSGTITTGANFKNAITAGCTGCP